MLDRVRRIVGSTGEGDLALAPRSEKALQMACLEARQLDRRGVETEHLLPALAGEREGGAARILADLGASYEEVLRRVSSTRDDDG